MKIEDILEVRGEITVESIEVHLALGGIITTGIRQGGELAINANPTLFDISDGFGYYVDSFTTPDDPSIIKVTWSGLTGISPTFLATNQFSSVAINFSALVEQQVTTYTTEESRDVLVLGSVFHPDNINISSTEDMSFDSGSSYLSRDISIALGTLNINGNNFAPVTTNLTLRKESGTSFRIGVNRNNDIKNPNFLNSVLVNPITFIYTYDDGSGGNAVILGQTNVDPNQYDIGTGTLASVPAGNNWTNQWCYFFPGSNVLVVRYGETIYNTLVLAQAAALTEIPTTIGIGFNTEFIRTVISIKRGATDLTDVEVAFTNTGRFGLGN